MIHRSRTIFTHGCYKAHYITLQYRQNSATYIVIMRQGLSVTELHNHLVMPSYSPLHRFYSAKLYTRFFWMNSL